MSRITLNIDLLLRLVDDNDACATHDRLFYGHDPVSTVIQREKIKIELVRINNFKIKFHYFVQHNEQQIKTWQQWIWQTNVLCRTFGTIVLTYTSYNYYYCLLLLLDYYYYYYYSLLCVTYRRQDWPQRVHCNERWVRSEYRPWQWSLFAVPSPANNVVSTTMICVWYVPREWPHDRLPTSCQIHQYLHRTRERVAY